MLEVKGYTIQEPLYSGRLFCVYRGIRKTDSQKVIIKTSSSDQPGLQEIATLQQEYHLLKQVSSPSIIQAYDLIRHQDKSLLIMEDIEGTSLKQYLTERPIALKEFFIIALQLVEALHTIYRQNIIHKDISLQNIVINPFNLTTKLIDFGLSSQLDQESQDSIPIQRLEGTLAYISPEQTGRMNRFVDYRTDFYSLGVSFYEMLTGRLPFETEDTLELVYSHLAAIPRSVHDLNPEIPEAVSGIVAKLMSKTPEERYISTIGLKEDLLKCQKEWLKNNKIAPFPLAQHDIYDRLLISQRLYGREDQVQDLLTAFDRVSQGSKEIFLVSGYSGIGKTSLVKEIYRPITRQHGYFISGKYDQLQHTTPYSAFIEAFQELVRRFLAEPQEQLDKLRQTLSETLGNNGQIIVDVIPDIALIIGPQPPVPELAPQEAQNRFMLTFQNFIRSIAQHDHPLVVFLDDLQWIDSASLSLLKIILEDPDLHYVFIVGAYRDNEVASDHPLISLQEEVQKKEIPLNHICLSPLNQQDVQHLLADTLNCEPKRVEHLANLLTEKTQGNPYFTNEILKKLYQDQILVFSHEKRRWQWDMERIYQEKITDNVVDLLLDQIRQLSNKTQTALKLAACIGHTFTLQTLAIINKQTPSEAAGDLLEAVQLNLLRPIGEQTRLIEWLKRGVEIDDPEKIAYRFNHDRIQQSAYQLIEESKRSFIHLTIGRLFVQDKPLEEKDERLFDILNHFNQGLPLVTSYKEKLMLAQANLWAGEKAKAATAYQIAANYLKAGIAVLPKPFWENHYDLSFSLHKAIAECEYLTIHFQEAEKHLHLLIEKSKTLFDKIVIYSLQFTMLETLGKTPEAVQVGAKALSLLGIDFPLFPKQTDILKAFLKVKLRIGFRRIQDLNLHPMTDEHHKRLHEIARKLLALLYYHDENLFALILFILIQSNLKYGYTEETPSIYLTYAFLLIHGFNKHKEGTAFIYLADKIVKEIEISPKNYAFNMFIFGSFIGPWRDPFEKVQDYLTKAYLTSLEGGDINIASLSLIFSVYVAQTKGESLLDISKKLQKALSFYEKFNHKILKIVLQEIEKTNHLLQTGLKTDEKHIENLQKTIDPLTNKTEIVNICTAHTRLYYIFNLFDLSLQAGELHEKYSHFNMGVTTHAEGKFYYALSLTALYEGADKPQKRLYAKKIKASYERFKVWATWCPENWRPYERLLAAEQARIKGQSVMAMDLYEQTILEAEENNILYLIGIASECAARFYLSLNKSRIAKVYLQKAHYAYTRWGALGKVDLLEKQYPELQQTPAHQKTSSLTTNFVSLSTTTPVNSLDTLSLFKSTQAISSEIRLDRLLQKLLVVLLQNAGAQRGMLLIKEDENWFVKAEGNTQTQHITVAHEEEITGRQDIPLSLVNYALRTQEKVLIQDAKDLESFLGKDAYLAQEKPQSILLLPIPYQGQIRTLLYLENKTTSHAFTPEHLQTLGLLTSQASISLENARLYYQATHDPLTGLANRNLLYQIFSHAAERAKREHNSIAILFLDLDKFKLINDKLGHEVGDKVLLHFAKTLEKCLRKGDIAARLGGDEFILMIDNIKNIAEVTSIAERVLRSLTKPVHILGHKISVETSIGISLYPQNATDIQDLLKQADIALYAVKEGGRGYYLFYQKDGMSKNPEIKPNKAVKIVSPKADS